MPSVITPSVIMPNVVAPSQLILYLHQAARWKLLNAGHYKSTTAEKKVLLKLSMAKTERFFH
jgi:hypothetical protein